MSKNAKILLVAASLIVALTACAPRSASFKPGETLYRPRYASGFTVFEAGERSAAIRIADPWQGADGVEQWVFVSREGEAAPEGFAGAVITSVPRRIICMSSSYTAFLGELGAADRIVGVSGAGFITDSLITARWAAGDIADVGYEANLDFERIASLRPDLVLIYGVTSGEGGATGKLREMGVPYVFVGEYLEESPLGRAEWIVALGEICGMPDGAKARFEAIERAYNDLKAQAAVLVAGSESRTRPEVMFNAPYRDVWYVPGDRNYMVRFVRDAGGEYVCRGVDSRDSRPIDIEEAFVAMQKADCWINTNHYSTMAALLADNPRFAGTRPVREGGGRVFNNNARTTPAGGSDFWESGVVRPDLVLRDLLQILHPADSLTATPLYYYKKLQ